MNLKHVPCFKIGMEAIAEDCSPRFRTKHTVICSSLSKAEEAGMALIPELAKKYDTDPKEFRIGSIRRLDDAYVEVLA